MTEDYREVLRVMQGLRLVAVGAAGDMLWIHFGELRTVLTRNGGKKEVGEWALHLQCPWRFVHDGVIVLASSDFYYDAETGDRHDFDSDRENVFHRNAMVINDFIEAQKPSVRLIEPGEAGAFEVRFDGDLKLSVMPVHSMFPQKMESWRLFEPGRTGPHFVFEEEGEQGGQANAGERTPQSSRP
jgi:hypothetical protein